MKSVLRLERPSRGQGWLTLYALALIISNKAYTLACADEIRVTKC
jgi:hypothetical protein